MGASGQANTIGLLVLETFRLGSQVACFHQGLPSKKFSQPGHEVRYSDGSFKNLHFQNWVDSAALHQLLLRPPRKKGRRSRFLNRVRRAVGRRRPFIPASSELVQGQRDLRS